MSKLTPTELAEVLGLNEVFEAANEDALRKVGAAQQAQALVQAAQSELQRTVRRLGMAHGAPRGTMPDLQTGEWVPAPQQPGAPPPAAGPLRLVDPEEAQHNPKLRKLMKRGKRR